MIKKLLITAATSIILLNGCGGGGGGTEPNYGNDNSEQGKQPIETKSDLTILSAKLVDADGNDITTDNKYEANSNLRVKLTVKNIGKEAIPELDSIVYCTTVNSITNCKTTNLSKLPIQLNANEEKTFIFDTKESISNSDDSSTFSFSINIDEEKDEYDNIDESSLFTELKKDNNSIGNMKIEVYKTDLEVSMVKLLLNGTTEITTTNPFSISNDNKDNNKISFCYKLKNVGEHNFYEWNITDEAISFNADAFGNWKPFSGDTINLNAGSETDLMCAGTSLPMDNLSTGDYEFETSFSYKNDINSDNNSKSMTYSITE